MASDSPEDRPTPLSSHWTAGRVTIVGKDSVKSQRAGARPMLEQLDSSCARTAKGHLVGRFSDPASGVGGNVPEGWEIHHAERWGKSNTTLYLRDPRNPELEAGFFYRFPCEATAAPDIDAWLLESAAAKMEQRRRDGWNGYTNLDHAFVELAHGRRGLAWRAQFFRRNQRWHEHLFRIHHPRGVFLLFLQVPAGRAAGDVEKFHALSHGVVIA